MLLPLLIIHVSSQMVYTLREGNLVAFLLEYKMYVDGSSLLSLLPVKHRSHFQLVPTEQG